jgi:adenylate cyclase
MNFSDSKNRLTGERIERRLAAILVADAVRYSRLMRNDEEATHRRLTALRSDAVLPTIARHRGRVPIPRIEPNGEFA